MRLRPYSEDMQLHSSDLELVEDGGDAQTVGMRFVDLEIPRGATIYSAYVQFQADEQDSETTTLTIHGQAIDDAPHFTSADSNISSRSTTAASAGWSPGPWTNTGSAGPNERTSDISAVIQEIVDRAGWDSGNALVLIVNGSGARVAESHNGDEGGAPLLHVEFIVGGGPVPVSAGFHNPTDKTEFSWPAQPGVSVFQVARAGTPDFLDERALFDVPANVFHDSLVPVPWGVLHYLVRPLVPEGSWGDDSEGNEHAVCLGDQIACTLPANGSGTADLPPAGPGIGLRR